MNEPRRKRHTTQTDATVMLISASDSAACAGMQADIRTCMALRTRATAVVTAVTAQNSLRMAAIAAVEPAMIRRQMECAAQQVRPDAVKIGLLPDAEIISTVAEQLRLLHLTDNIVVDPVAAPTAQGEFFDAYWMKAWRDAMTGELLPLCKIATPNLPELGLLGEGRTAQELLSLWRCGNILVKGGHGTDDHCTQDLLWRSGKPTPLRFTSQRVNTRHLRGTGCVLSSAIACYLAEGYDVEEAVKRAHDFLQERIRHASGIQAYNDESVI